MEQTNELELAIAAMQDAVQPALADINSFRPSMLNIADAVSSHASPNFKTMFKDGTLATYVKGILRQIVAFTPIPNLFFEPERLAKPTFVCASPKTDFLAKGTGASSPSKFCEQEGQNYYGQALPQAALIFFCDLFWTYPITPEGGSYCPEIRYNSIWRMTSGFEEYKAYAILHELIHIYLGNGNSLGVCTKPVEQYGMNCCILLSLVDSVHNPDNFVYYVACKYRTVV